MFMHIGVVSSGTDTMSPIESVPMTTLNNKTVLLSHSAPNSSPIFTQTVASGSPVPQFDDEHYYSTTGLQNTLELHTKIDTAGSSSTPPSQNNNTRNHKFTSSLNTALPPPSIILSSDSIKPGSLSNDQNFHHMSTSPIESPTSKSHYYSSPTTDVSNLSFPMVGGIYDTINEYVPEVPSAEDPELMPTYDQISIPKKKVTMLLDCSLVLITLCLFTGILMTRCFLVSFYLYRLRLFQPGTLPIILRKKCMHTCLQV